MAKSQSAAKMLVAATVLALVHAAVAVSHLRQRSTFKSMRPLIQFAVVMLPQAQTAQPQVTWTQLCRPGQAPTVNSN